MIDVDDLLNALDYTLTMCAKSMLAYGNAHSAAKPNATQAPRPSTSRASEATAQRGKVFDARPYLSDDT